MYSIIRKMMQQLQSYATSRIHHMHVLSLDKNSSFFLQCLLHISLVYNMHTAFFYHRFSYKLQNGAWRYSTDHVCVQMNVHVCKCVYVCAHAHILRVNVLYILCMYRTFRTGCNMKFLYLSSMGHPTLK